MTAENIDPFDIKYRSGSGFLMHVDGPSAMRVKRAGGSSSGWGFEKGTWCPLIGAAVVTTKVAWPRGQVEAPLPDFLCTIWAVFIQGHGQRYALRWPQKQNIALTSVSKPFFLRVSYTDLPSPFSRTLAMAFQRSGTPVSASRPVDIMSAWVAWKRIRVFS